MKGASSLINIAGSTSANKILPVDSGLQSLPKSEQIIQGWKGHYLSLNYQQHK